MNSNASTADALFWTRAGEMLHNGIVLPAERPPKPNHHSGEPMPAPYLEHPPEIIPIDVGRQLLMDGFLIEETTLERTFHAAEYHPRQSGPQARQAVGDGRQVQRGLSIQRRRRGRGGGGGGRERGIRLRYRWISGPGWPGAAWDDSAGAAPAERSF